MNEQLIRFKNIDGKKTSNGIEQKVYSQDGKKMRLLKFFDNFREVDWCTKGHTGFVLKGEMKIDFNGHIKKYKKGDGLWISKGLPTKHKVIIEKGKQVELILFEEE